MNKTLRLNNLKTRTTRPVFVICIDAINCYRWKVNSLTAHNMAKLSSIAAYNTIHKYDFICISETYLDDRDTLINGYNLIRAYHPSSNKRSGVCIY